MTEIQKIERYIKRTGVEYSDGTPYQMKLSDISGLHRMANDDLIGALCLAFEYGRAKGERSAKAAQKRLRREVTV